MPDAELLRGLNTYFDRIDEIAKLPETERKEEELKAFMTVFNVIVDWILTRDKSAQQELFKIWPRWFGP